MGEKSVFDISGLLHVHVPHICSADLIAKCHDLLVLVHREPNKPDLTILAKSSLGYCGIPKIYYLESNFVYDGNLVFSHFLVLLLLYI